MSNATVDSVGELRPFQGAVQPRSPGRKPPGKAMMDQEQPPSSATPPTRRSTLLQFLSNRNTGHGACFCVGGRIRRIAFRVRLYGTRREFGQPKESKHQEGLITAWWSLLINDNALHCRCKANGQSFLIKTIRHKLKMCRYF